MLVLHVGLPKTATTFLQHRVLARCPELCFVHRTGGPAQAEICRDLRFFAKAGALRAALRRRTLGRRIRALADGWPEREAAGRVVVSDENVAVHAAGFWTAEGPGPERLARRLAALGRGAGTGPLRVVLGVRRQDQWLASRYAESSKHFAEFGQADFDRRMARIAADAPLDGPLRWLDFAAVRGAFAAALGAENVLVLPLERIAVDEAGALADLARFLGVASLARASSRRDRRLGRPAGINRLGDGADLWRLRRDGSPLRLSSELKAALRARFAASNAALAAAIGPALDL